MKILLYVVSIFTLTITTAFTQDHSTHKGDSMAKMQMARKVLKAKDHKELLEVFRTNENLHQAFYNYNPENVYQETKKVIDAINKVSLPELTKLLSHSKDQLKSIKKESSKKRSAEAYHMFSSALGILAKKYEIKDYNQYHCPMAKKNWIQNTSKSSVVQNPYLPSMKTCGEQQTSF